MGSESRNGIVWPNAGTVALLIACVATSLAGFHHRWNRYPEAVDAAVGATIVAPFAIPKSCADMLGLTSPNSTRGTLLAAAVFWPVACGLLGWLFAYRSLAAFVALAALMLTASINWQVVANGMIGL